MFGKVTIDIGDLIAVAALLLAAASFYVHLRDRAPHLRVSVDHDEIVDDETGPVGDFLWIDIVNTSTHRLKASTIWVEWGRPRWPTWSWKRLVCPDLQVAEEKANYGQYRFWVEPWGDVAFSTDFDGLTDELASRAKAGRYWLRVAVRDSQGKWTRSNKLAFNVRESRGRS